MAPQAGRCYVGEKYQRPSGRSSRGNSRVGGASTARLLGCVQVLFPQLDGQPDPSPAQFFKPLLGIISEPRGPVRVSLDT